MSINILLQNSLVEIQRLIKSRKNKEAEIISDAIADIKNELTSADLHIKVCAIAKLSYFSMLGYNADYGAFSIIEIIANTNFKYKRIGYRAASIVFHHKLSVLPLMTAQLRKDLTSPTPYEVKLALYCLSSICTVELAKDLTQDVLSLLSHNTAYIRSHAVLCLYSISLVYPESRSLITEKFKEKIDIIHSNYEKDPVMYNSIINVCSELARHDQTKYFTLVKPLFRMVKKPLNNWTLIKLVKLYDSFIPYEPRFGSKTVNPLTDILMTSNAKSVQYECIIITAQYFTSVEPLLKLSVAKIKEYIGTSDFNLILLGLEAFIKIIHINPRFVVSQRDIVIPLLGHLDIKVRQRALEIILSTTNRKNFIDTVECVYQYMERDLNDENWINICIYKVIELAKLEKHAMITNWEWYFSLLCDLASINISYLQHGKLLEAELLCIISKFESIRPFAVASLLDLLEEETLWGRSVTNSTHWCILTGASYAVGEYPQYINNTVSLFKRLLHPRLLNYPTDLQEVALYAVFKIILYTRKPLDCYSLGNTSQEPSDEITTEKLLEFVNSEITSVQLETLQPHIYFFCHSPYISVRDTAKFIRHQLANYLPSIHMHVEEDIPMHEANEISEVDLNTPFGELPDFIQYWKSAFHVGTSSSDEESVNSSSSLDWTNLPKDNTIAGTSKETEERRVQLDAYYIPESIKIEKTEVASNIIQKQTKVSRRSKINLNVTDFDDDDDEHFPGTVSSDVIKHVENKPYDINDSLKKHAISSMVCYDQEDLKPVGPKMPTSEFILYNKHSIQLILTYSNTTSKNNGLVIEFNCKVSNENTSSLHNIKLTSTALDTYTISDDLRELECSEVKLNSRIKSGSTTVKNLYVYLKIVQIKQFEIKVNFQLGKQDYFDNCYYQPVLHHILKHKISTPSSTDGVAFAMFNQEEIESIKAYVCLSTKIKLGRGTSLQMVLQKITNSLPFFVIDTFDESVCLYSKIISKKNSSLIQKHIFLLLKSSNKSSKLQLVAKAHDPSIIEELFQEIAKIIEK